MADLFKLGMQPMGPEEAPQDPFGNLDPVVAQYMRNKYSVADAKQNADTTDKLAGGVNVANAIMNAMSKPVALQNRMQDLGKAPTMIEASQYKNDVSGLQKQAQMKLAQATSDEDNAVKMAFEQRKAELAAEAQAKKAQEEAAWREREFQQKERGIQAQAKAREAYAAQALGLKRDQLNLQRDKFQSDGKEMPIEDKKVVETLATKNAGKISIANQIDSYLKEFNSASDQATKLRIGGQMLKVLNSPEGADAIGVEEAKRLGDALEFQVFNVFGPGPMFGRDLEGFEAQVQGTSDAIKGGVQTNRNEISRITGRGAQAAPAKVRVSNGTEILEIDPSDLADAEMDGYQRLP